MHSAFIAIHKAFKEEGIEIPYAKREVYLTETTQKEDSIN